MSSEKFCCSKSIGTIDKASAQSRIGSELAPALPRERMRADRFDQLSVETKAADPASRGSTHATVYILCSQKVLRRLSKSTRPLLNRTILEVLGGVSRLVSTILK